MSVVSAKSSIETIPSGDALGAEIKGVDLAAPVAEDVQKQLGDAWAAHQVLLFRDQELNEEDILAVARIFGEGAGSHARKFFLKGGYKPGGHRISKLPGVSYISNLDEDGKPVKRNGALGSLEVDWHTDNSYIEVPPAGTLLYSVQNPDNGGGDTSFSNQFLAWETLPEDLKQACFQRYQKHDRSRNSTGQVRVSLSLPRSYDEIEGAVHPLVRIHPVNGKPTLYLGLRRDAPANFILDIPYDESEELLAALWSHATKPEFAWTHKWRAGDLIIWDNRSTMHYRSAVDHTRPRVLYRTLVKGEPLVAPWD